MLFIPIQSFISYLLYSTCPNKKRNYTDFFFAMVDRLAARFAAKSWWFGDQEEEKTSGDDTTSNICTATLYDHQERAIEWLREIEHGGMLCLTMGLGKSLTVAYWSLMVEKANRVLLVASKSLVPNWISMLNQFFPGLSYDVLHADIGENPKTYTCASNARFVIVTYDVVMSMASLHNIRVLVYRENQGYMSRTKESLSCKGPGSWLFSTRFDVAISDESQIFRNPCGTLYPAMLGLTAQKYICLTGTPIQNTFDDLYTQLKWMNIPGVEHYELFTQSRFDELGWGKHVLMMGYEDAGIQLPECIEHDIELTFTSEESKAYGLLRQEGKSAKKGPSILALITRLRFGCLCIGLAYRKKNVMTVPPELKRMLRDPTSVYWYHSTKFKAVRDCIQQIVDKGEKVIVFSTFLSALREFGEGLEKLMGIHPVSVDGSMDIEYRQSMIETFKTSTLHPVMLLTFQIGAEGMNLTEANHIIFLDSWWSPSVTRQAIARALRIGQTKKVHVYTFRMKNSIENRVYEIVQNKSEIVEQFETGIMSNDTYRVLLS